MASGSTPSSTPPAVWTSPGALHCINEINGNGARTAALQSQVEEMHVVNEHLAVQTNHAQIIEPEFKRMKNIVSDMQLNIIELRRIA